MDKDFWHRKVKINITNKIFKKLRMKKSLYIVIIRKSYVRETYVKST